MIQSPMIMRLRRLVRQFHEIHEQTGSLLTACRFTIRKILAKTPILLRQAGSCLKTRRVSKETQAVRDNLHGAKPFIGIRVSGGLGDFLVVARFLRDLRQCCGDFIFDIYSTRPELAKWVFGSLEGMRESHDDILFEFTLSEYDLAARISQFVIFHEGEASWRQLRLYPRLMQAVAHAIRYRPKIDICIERHPYLDGLLAQKAVFENCSRRNFLHHMTGIPYGGDSLRIQIAEGTVARYGLARRRYITVHNGFDPAFVITSRRATKCYPHFDQVIQMLRRTYPDLCFVQIGSSTSEAISTVDLNLLGRTSLPEAAALIEQSLLHLDNESGLVHLASCLGTASCVVFGPTPSSYFSYEQNINIDPAFCGGCWWITESWMSVCPRGFPAARCMTDQDPSAIASAIDARIQMDPHYGVTARTDNDFVPNGMSRPGSIAQNEPEIAMEALR